MTEVNLIIFFDICSFVEFYSGKGTSDTMTTAAVTSDLEDLRVSRKIDIEEFLVLFENSLFTLEKYLFKNLTKTKFNLLIWHASRKHGVLSDNVGVIHNGLALITLFSSVLHVNDGNFHPFRVC